MTLLDLPNELIIRIFCESSSMQDALALSSTCFHLRNLFNEGGNTFRILRNAAGIPRSFADELKRDKKRLGVVGPGEFLVQDGSDLAIHIKLDYSYFTDEDVIEDGFLTLLHLRRYVSFDDFDATVSEFCYQFYATDHRRACSSDIKTQPLLQEAGRLQAWILSETKKTSSIREDLCSTDTILALALDVYATAEQAGVASLTRLMGNTDYRFDESSRDDVAPYISPSISVRRMQAKDAPKLLVDEYGEEITLESKLYALCQLFDQLISRQDMRHDPVPLLLVIGVIRATMGVMEMYWLTGQGPLEQLALKYPRPIDHVWLDMCRLFYIYTKGMSQPSMFEDTKIHPGEFWWELDRKPKSCFERLVQLVAEANKTDSTPPSKYKELMSMNKFHILVHRLFSERPL